MLAGTICVAQRNNHYDAALEEYLRRLRVPYVAVDEAKRALFAEVSLKSLDFIIYSHQGPNLLVDVKGRRFPSGGTQRHYWENWSTRDDIESLRRWQDVFGSDFLSMLIFAYNLCDARSLQIFEEPFSYRERSYAFVALTLEDYCKHLRVRSSRWATVSLPTAEFRRLIRPLAEFL